MSKYDNVVAEYDYYTLDQAREIIYAEMVHDQKMRQYRAKRRKRERIYYIKQKLCGIALIGIGIVSILMLKDATISIITIPLGRFLFVTRKKLTSFLY